MSDREMLLGRYELRGVLGRGGMAEVRDGWDTRLHRAVAVKLLHPALGTDADTRRRFEDEARSAAALNHPNIVSVHDCGVDDGRFFIVMERLPGQTLHDLIARGPLPAPRVRAVLDDVLAALTVAHGAGVLHRDIKPANILVSADGTAMKVADFGIAKTAGAAHTMTGQIIGTMAYMSPERLGGAAASVADDLYALGMIGFEAATGGQALPQDNPAVLARAILDGPAPSLAGARPDVDPVLAAVVDRAVSKDPRQRFTDAAQMRAALTTGMPRPATKVLDAPLPPPADPDYFVPARKRRLSRNQTFLAAAAAFLVALVALLLVTVDSRPAGGGTEPVGTSSVAPPSPPPSSSPAPVVSPVAPPPERPKGDKGEKKRNGNSGNQDNPGNGNKKRE
ncbi:serine/threonine-protein kinase [Mycobacterium sp. AMU20-3851]|uniref:serine/threonine-protein kinase n=1 Tax=Mycobacterium sp. AMU20-3851 TaxID=3122055 RepID=UPI0037541BC8